MQQDRPDVPVAGDVIWIRRRQWRVKDTCVGAGLTRVVVEGWAPAESRIFLLPCDRWSSGEPRRARRVSVSRALACLAALASHAHRAGTPGAIVHSKAALLAYQLEPALAVLSGKRRILIADDVGLGKTIQAGLIVAEILQRQADARILVLAPSSLTAQWRQELRSRFFLSSHVADAETFTRLRAERAYLSNPWLRPGVWIASIDYLKQPHVLDGLPPRAFDVVVIDEAHTLAGDSQRHAAANTIARAAQHVILLTATPHDGSATRFGRLLALGGSGAPADALTVFKRSRPRHNRRLRNLFVKPSTGLSRVLDAIDSFERTRRPGASSDALALICGVFRKRALSSAGALASSLKRRMSIIGAGRTQAGADDWIQPGLRFDSDSEQGDVTPLDEWSALTVVTGLPAMHERAWLERLNRLIARDAGDGDDPKIVRLTRLLRKAREPVVVFTEYRDSLLAIERAVSRYRRVAVLHGGLSSSEQRHALRLFLSGRADVLLATDVASQGLNLQHRARWVVHFDLPWTPVKLEQRTGRVDRIGQTRPVHVTTMGVRHHDQRSLEQRLLARQNASESALLPSCARWSRAATGLARWFDRQRAVGSVWRGPELAGVLRASAGAATFKRLCGDSSTRTITIVEVPLVTGTGNVIERWFGWITGQWPLRSPLPGQSPVLLRRTMALAERERRVTARLHAARATDAAHAPTQPGLFEVRHLTGACARGRDMVEPRDAARALEIQVGRARPILILDRRP